MILAGDIGGTKTNLALVREDSGRLIMESLTGYPSRGRRSFTEILQEYLAAHPVPITRAAFGIAGPVLKGRCEATNLPWIVDAGKIAERLQIAQVHLLNDLEATAYGVLRLAPEELLTLNPGATRPQGTIAVIAAGTGLGEGGLVWTGQEYHTLPSEGGHTDFAPRNDLEIELLRFLLRQHERVSYERIISGPGLVQLYRFFRERTGGPEPQWLTERLAGAEAAAAVSRAALEGKDRACADALDLFVSIYGAEAGNLALKLLAFGGVYVAGGIAPKILPALKAGGFLSAFTFKGRFSHLLTGMPVHVVLNDKAAILGAAHHALMENGPPS